jgi:hypothetical protein
MSHAAVLNAVQGSPEARRAQRWLADLGARVGAPPPIADKDRSVQVGRHIV